MSMFKTLVSLRGAAGRVALSVLREGRIETEATKQSPVVIRRLLRQKPRASRIDIIHIENIYA